MSAILSPWSGAPFLTSVSRTRTKYCPSETTKSTHEGSSLGWPEATSPDGRPNTIQVAEKTAYFLHDQETRRQAPQDPTSSRSTSRRPPPPVSGLSRKRR